jgi:RNA polymerase sigma-70 factor (ECF subfamily)
MGGPTADSAATQRLLERARTGDRAAFEQLFAQHRAFLRQIVELRMDPRLRGRVDPSDVVQEAQLDAFRRLRDYLNRRPMPFRLWLHKTAQEHLLKVHRRHAETGRRAIHLEVPLPEHSSVLLARRLLAAGSSPSQRLGKRETARRVWQAIAALPESDREILIMRNFEGLSNQEVACLLELEPATASKRHGRALLRLRRYCSTVGFRSPSYERRPGAANRVGGRCGWPGCRRVH